MSLFSGAKKFIEDIGMGLVGGGAGNVQALRGAIRPNIAFGNSDIVNNPRSQMNDVRDFVRGNRRDPIGQFPRQPRYEDEGFVGSPRNLNQYSPMNADVKNYFDINPDLALRLQGGLRVGQPTSNPMNFDTIPNNYTAGRTGYYQGSNPYLNDLDYYSQLRVR